MAIQMSEAVRNAMLDAIENTAGTAAVLKIFDDGNNGGSVPADCAAADVGTVLFDITLPSDWMGDAASGSKSLAGTWEDTSADNAGIAEYFRLYNSGETTCHMQGTVTGSGGGGDMELQNDNIAAGQALTITTFTLTAGNA